MRGKRLWLAGLALAGVCMAAANQESRAGINCANYILIDSRGSGEVQTSPPGAVFWAAMTDYIRKQRPTATTLEIDNPYPATGSDTVMVGALLKLPGAYHQSVVSGKQWLKNEIKSLSKTCPRGAILLSGYSQGAQVTADVYQAQSWPQVKGVVLFGDPYFNPADPADKGSFSKGKRGALGRRPLYARSTSGKVVSYCHLHDPVCQGVDQAILHGFSQHENYNKLGEPQAAARVLANKLLAKPAAASQPGASELFFTYTSLEGYRYNLRLSISTPSFGVDRSGNIPLVWVNKPWARLKVINPTQHEEPLGSEGNGFKIYRFTGLSSALKTVWADNHQCYCQTPQYVDLGDYEIIDFHANRKYNIGPGSTVELKSLPYDSPPAILSHASGWAWLVTENEIKAWQELFKAEPDYYVVTGEPEYLGSNGTAATIASACAYERSGISIPIFALFTGSGKQLPLGGANCAKARKLMNEQD